jgi:hypothetical protein
VQPGHPRVLVFATACLLAGCRVSEPKRVVAGHHELCCKSANADNLGFVGCRASRSCRTSERVWVRGPVTCEPPDPQRCAGGRCCQLDLEALALLELDAAQVVEGPNVGTPVETESEPVPALIVPVPGDGRACPRG